MKSSYLASFYDSVGEFLFAIGSLQYNFLHSVPAHHPHCFHRTDTSNNGERRRRKGVNERREKREFGVWGGWMTSRR